MTKYNIYTSSAEGEAAAETAALKQRIRYRQWRNDMSLATDLLLPVWLAYEMHANHDAFAHRLPAFVFKYSMWVSLVIAAFALRGMSEILPVSKLARITVPVPLLPALMLVLPHRCLVAGFELCAQAFAWLEAGDLFALFRDLQTDLGICFLPTVMLVLLGIVAMTKNWLIVIFTTLFGLGGIVFEHAFAFLFTELHLHLPAALVTVGSVWHAGTVLQALDAGAGTTSGTMAAWLNVIIDGVALVVVCVRTVQSLDADTQAKATDTMAMLMVCMYIWAIFLGYDFFYTVV